MQDRRVNPRKLLVASVGVATLNYLGTGATACSSKVVDSTAQGVGDAAPTPTVANLMAPPPTPTVANLMAPPPTPTVANLMAPPPMPTVANLMAPPPLPDAGRRDANVPPEAGNAFDASDGAAKG